MLVVLCGIEKVITVIILELFFGLLNRQGEIRDAMSTFYPTQHVQRMAS